MKEAMKTSGLTSGQVAVRLGVKDGTVRGWTTGRHNITVENLTAFAELVRYPIEHFINRDYRLDEQNSTLSRAERLAEELAGLTDRLYPKPRTITRPADRVREVMSKYVVAGKKLTVGDVEQMSREIEELGEE